jgi:glycosyltransferase involved in cell wall biosynthesis
LFRIPVFVDVQDLFPGEFPLNRIIKIGCMPRYIALGSEVEKILLSIGIPIHRILTLPPARLSMGRDIKGIPEGTGDETNITLLFIGGLTKIKGIDILLEAFKLVSSKTESISLKIIGDGQMREFCEDFIDKNNLDIKLLGAFNHERTLKEISSSDIVVLASRTEGYPRVILEAFEFGKPVIATNVGGIPQLLKNGENGILVDPCDHAGLAGAILKLCNDKGLRDKLGKSGKQSLEGMLSFEDSVKKIVEFYVL